MPKKWFSNPDKSSFWITGYKIIYPNADELKLGSVFDFELARTIIFNGEMSYPRCVGIPSVEIKDNTLSVEGLKFEDYRSSKSTWLLILQPYESDEKKNDEYLVKRKASSIAGLYGAINGFNMVYQRMFDFFSTMSGKSSCASPTFVNPGAYPLPNLSSERLQAIFEIGKLIDQLEPHKRRRVELALYWFEAGQRALGLDGFIKYWIAIETLAMPDGTNIKPLNETLAKIYGLSVNDVANKFGVGRIFSLRSRILHNGDDLSIHQDLSEYMEALFSDVLLDHLNVPTAKRVIKLVSNPEFNIQKLTHT